MFAPKKMLWVLLIMVGILFFVTAYWLKRALHSAIPLREIYSVSTTTTSVQDLLLSAFWAGFCLALLVVGLVLFFSILIRGRPGI